MAEITAITPQVKDKTRCNIYVDGRFYCGLTLETTVRNRLKVGQTIDENKLAALQFESEKETALDKALTHITATQKTEKQIREFLAGKGFLPPVIDYVVEKMRGYNFINDEEYAAEYARFASRKKGGKLIKMELRAKGIADEAIEAAIDGLDEDAEENAARDALEKYLRGKERNAVTFQKAYRYLLGKGFSYDAAKKALAEFTDMDDET